MTVGELSRADGDVGQGAAPIGGAWLTSHPGGRLDPVGEFFEHWRRLLAPLTADISDDGA
jgi:hypothetical protein